jgi:hypothetical protein
LLLSKATIFPDRIVGELEIGAGRCIGFSFKRDLEATELVIRGTELIDMAAQLLGVRGSRFKELMLRRQNIVLLRTGLAEFIRPVCAGVVVEMTISFSDIKVWGLQGTKGNRVLIEGGKFVARVNGDVCAVIHDVILMSTA